MSKKKRCSRVTFFGFVLHSHFLERDSPSITFSSVTDSLSKSQFTPCQNCQHFLCGTTLQILRLSFTFMRKSTETIVATMFPMTCANTWKIQRWLILVQPHRASIAKSVLQHGYFLTLVSCKDDSR